MRHDVIDHFSSRIINNSEDSQDTHHNYHCYYQHDSVGLDPHFLRNRSLSPQLLQTHSFHHFACTLLFYFFSTVWYSFWTHRSLCFFAQHVQISFLEPITSSTCGQLQATMAPQFLTLKPYVIRSEPNTPIYATTDLPEEAPEDWFATITHKEKVASRFTNPPSESQLKQSR